MAASYVQTNLKTSQKDLARFQLGDTGALKDESGAVVWLLQDEEITSLIELFGYAEGVSQCCDALVNRFSQEPVSFQDETGVQVNFYKRMDGWTETAKRLRAGVAQTAGMAGGTPRLAQTTGPDMKGWPSR